MSPTDRDFKSISEIGKLYSSLIEKKSLCEFFPQSVALSIDADQGCLFVSGREEKIWLEASLSPLGKDQPAVTARAEQALRDGKPFKKDREIFVPLIVRNEAIGVAYFSRESGKPSFTPKDLEIAFDLSSQMAAALKNVLLFEQNLEMEKLAAVGKSMSMVMHEIKNIIQLATFAEEWLMRALKDPKPQYLERGVAGIKKALKEMNGFVYEMLSLTKDYKIHPQKVNLKSLVNELHEDLKPRAGSILLDFSVEEAIGEVDGEERSLYRALLNLIKNAIEACDKEQSVIALKVKNKDKDTYVITVSDNGQGMTDEVKAKLFQAFFSTKGERGTGLGVMIVNKTIKAHGGKIEIESVSGKGTTFILTLPKVILTED